MTRSFIKSSFFYIFSTSAVQALAFIRIPIFTRLVATSEYGEVATFFSLATVASVVFGLGVSGTIARQVVDIQGRVQQYLSAAAISVVTVLTMGLSIAGLLYYSNMELLHFSTFLLIALFIDAISQIVFSTALSIWNIRKQSGIYALVSFSFAGTNLLLTILLLLLGSFSNVTAIVAGTMIAKLLFAFGCLPTIGKIGFSKPSSHDFIGLWKFGLPLVPHMLSINLLALFDRIAIAQLVGTQATGLYSAAYNIGTAVTGVLFALATAFSPEFYDRMNKFDRQGLKDLYKLYWITGRNVTILGIGVLPTLATFLLGENYRQSIYLIPLIVLGAFFHFNYFPFLNFQCFEKETVGVAHITIIAALFNIVSNILLIPLFGFEISALTTVGSYFLLFIGNYINAKKMALPRMFLSIEIRQTFDMLLVVATSIAAYFVFLRFLKDPPMLFFVSFLVVFGVLFRFVVFEKRLYSALWPLKKDSLSFPP